MKLNLKRLVMPVVLTASLALGAVAPASADTTGKGKAAVAKPGPMVLVTTVYSPLEHAGTTVIDHHKTTNKLHPDFGFWWGGFYQDVITNNFQASNVQEDPRQAFLTLGRGACEETTRTTQLTGTINISGGAQFTDEISGSFGFSGSGSRTFSVTNKYCGPGDSSPYSSRTWYKTLDYNRFSTVAIRMYYTWSGIYDHMDPAINATDLVPHMAIYSQDQ